MSSGGQRYSTKAVKSIPISAKSFRPAGTIQLANIVEEKECLSHGGEEIFTSPDRESLRKHSLSRIWPKTAKCVSEFRQHRYTRALDTLAAAKSFPLLHGWLQSDYPRKRKLTSHLIVRSFRSARVRQCRLYRSQTSLARGSPGPVYFAKRVSPQDHRENPRENIGSNRADIVSFPFPLTGTSQAIALFSSVDAAERRVLPAVFDA